MAVKVTFANTHRLFPTATYWKSNGTSVVIYNAAGDVLAEVTGALVVESASA